MSKEVFGTLSDSEIIRRVNLGELITEGFNGDCVKQACYEVSASNIYFDLSSGGKKEEVEEGDAIVFKPHQTIVIITKEKFSLPNDILVRFLTKGSLFSVGFTAVNTYADPGFHGKMGIVMTNASNNYLKIESGSVIAKAEFTKLQRPVEETYHGQHGFETGVWPIKEEFIIPREQLNKYYPEYNEIKEIEDIYGKPVADVIRRILVTEKRFIIATIFVIIADLIIIGLALGTEWTAPLTTVILGILVNLIYAGISFTLMNWRWKKGK